VLPIVERLRLKVQRFPATGGGSIGIDANGKTVSSSYITGDGKRYANPDGPEAADTIEKLVKALKALTFLWNSYQESDLSQMNAHDCLVHYDTWNRARDLLAKLEAGEK
jgi:hypothetical protein